MSDVTSPACGARADGPVPPSRQARLSRTQPFGRAGACGAGLAALLLLLAGCSGDHVSPLVPDLEDPTLSRGPAGTSVLQVRIATADAPTMLLQYRLRVGETTRSVTVNDTITIPQLPTGSLEIALENVPSGCQVAGANPRVLGLDRRGLTVTDFNVQCGRDPGGAGPASPAGESLTQVVGSAGGTLTVSIDDGTEVSLHIPAGAIWQNVPVTITPASFAGGPSGLHYVGGVILEPSGLEFATPAMLTVRPRGGLTGGPFLGVLFDDAGAPEWFLPELTLDGTGMRFPVPHFSSAALTVADLGPYLTVTAALTGTSPQLVEDGPGQVSFLAPSAVPSVPGEFCALAFVRDNGARRPVSGVLVEFGATADGAILGSQAALTDPAGRVCVTADIATMDLNPAGTVVTRRAELMLPTQVPVTTDVRLLAIDERAPLGIELEPLPSSIRNDSELTACAVVSGAAGEGVPGVEVDFGLQGPATARSGSNGRACVTRRIELPDPSGSASEPFDFQVSAAFVTTSASRGQPGQLTTVSRGAMGTVSVDRPALNAQLGVAGPIRLGTNVGVCVALRRGEDPAPGVPLTLDIDGPGSWLTTQTKRVGGFTDPDGNACWTYVPPSDTSEGTEVRFEAEYELRGDPPGRTRTKDLKADILELPYLLTLTATPDELGPAGGTSQVCGVLRRTDDQQVVPGASVVFSLASGGVGELVGSPAITNAQGTACVTYLAPDPLPTEATEVVVLGSATLGDGSAQGSASVRLQTSRNLLALVGTPSVIRTAGGTSSVCATLTRESDGQPVAEAPVRFTLDGEGSLSDAGAPVDTDSDGVACVTYTAPSPLPDVSTIVTLDAEADPGDGRATAQTTLTLDAETYAFSVTAQFLFLNGPGLSSAVCGRVTMGSPATAVPGIGVTFSLTGIGSLSANQAVTNQNGAACITYTTPDPLPDGLTTTQTISATAATPTGPLSAERTINVAGRLRILTTALDSPLTGEAYSRDILAGGGGGGRTWELIGSLPPGLGGIEITDRGGLYRIVGEPVEAGETNFTLVVRSGAQVDSVRYDFLVREPTTFTVISGGNPGSGLCSLSLAQTGSHTSPPFTLTASVSPVCPAGTRIVWSGDTRYYGSEFTAGFFSIPLALSPLAQSSSNPEFLFTQAATVSYDREVFATWVAQGRKPEGTVRACLESAAGEPILTEPPFPDQICVSFRWFN